VIVGARRWADRSTYYRQDNDLLEEIRRKLGDKGVLQSCGSDAAGSCIEAVGWDLEDALATRAPSGYSVPADDLLTEWLNNRRNYPLLRRETGIDPELEPNNRHARMLVVAARELWGIIGQHTLMLRPNVIADELGRGNAVQACLTPPGHYVAIVAYDEATGELIYNDSWSARKPEWLGDGFGKRMTQAEEAALAWEGIIWQPPEA